MSDLFLEQRINVEFCVKLGKDASDTCAMLSEAYGGETMKESKCFRVAKTVQMGQQEMNTMLITSSISRV
jgi:fructosamine-3-kinase